MNRAARETYGLMYQHAARGGTNGFTDLEPEVLPVTLDHDLVNQYRSAVFTRSNCVSRQRSICLSHAALTLKQINQDLLIPLIRIRDHIECVTPLIHDLWSEQMFVTGFAYGPSSVATSGTHPLLKPYDLFTKEERSLEKILARGDLEGILEGIRDYVANAPPSGQPVQATRRFTARDFRLTSQLLFQLAENTDFLNRVAPSIHDNWRRAKRQTRDLVPDPRIGKTFEALTEAERAVTLSNTRLDILATAASLAQESVA
jgi:hypothetical protein